MNCESVVNYAVKRKASHFALKVEAPPVRLAWLPEAPLRCHYCAKELANWRSYQHRGKNYCRRCFYERKAAARLKRIRGRITMCFLAGLIVFATVVSALWIYEKLTMSSNQDFESYRPAHIEPGCAVIECGAAEPQPRIIEGAGA
jgi:hypothetical protein